MRIIDQDLLQQMKQKIPGSDCVTIQHHNCILPDISVTAQQLQEGSIHKPLAVQRTLQTMVLASTGQEAMIAPQPPPEQLRGRRIANRPQWRSFAG